MLSVGETAPEFALPDSDMRMAKLSDYRGQNLVVYFYPKDDTTGCTIEALELTDLADDFKELNTEILGVSRDNCVSHANFRDKHGLSVRLLADTEGEACEKYGVWQEKEKNGQTYMGIVRSTFVINTDGIIQHAMYDVKPKGHANAVLALIKEL